MHIKEQILKLFQFKANLLKGFLKLFMCEYITPFVSYGATAGSPSFDKYLKYDKLDTWFYCKIVVNSQEQDRRSYNGH